MKGLKSQISDLRFQIEPHQRAYLRSEIWNLRSFQHGTSYIRATFSHSEVVLWISGNL